MNTKNIKIRLGGSRYKSGGYYDGASVLLQTLCRLNKGDGWFIPKIIEDSGRRRRNETPGT